ncbi:MAG: hypothetical protein ACR2NW_09295 [Thermodesulfobacteriota bacterium]
MESYLLKHAKTKGCKCSTGVKYPYCEAKNNCYHKYKELENRLPENDDENDFWEAAYKDYPYKLSGEKIDVNRIITTPQQPLK